MLKRNELRKKEIEDKLTRTLDLVESVENLLPAEFEEFKENEIKKDAIYKRIESAIQNLIDVSAMINSDLRLGIPDTEDNIINHLENNKIFDKKIIFLIQEMKKFRNVLVHKYGDIDDEQAFESIKEGLKDFETIINEIEKFLKKYR